MCTSKDYTSSPSGLCRYGSLFLTYKLGSLLPLHPPQQSSITFSVAPTVSPTATDLVLDSLIPTAAFQLLIVLPSLEHLRSQYY
jgi:hypothetical protein